MNINSYVVFVLIFRYSGGKSEEIIGDMDCLKDSKVQILNMIEFMIKSSTSSVWCNTEWTWFLTDSFVLI